MEVARKVLNLNLINQSQQSNVSCRYLDEIGYLLGFIFLNSAISSSAKKFFPQGSMRDSDPPPSHSILRCFKKRSSKIKATFPEGQDSVLPGLACRRFSLAELRAATNDFSTGFAVGMGGFGNIYRGFIENGSLAVVIKRLNPNSRDGTHQFQTEVLLLSQLRHPHFVSLIGFCHEESEMLLVYEFMSNGSLLHHLTYYDPISWKQRLEICIGAARGLHYLHTGAKHAVIHRDVKTANILLDDKMSAKISDFSLSKMGPESMSTALIRVESIVRGTWGYVDPEYIKGQQLTEKSDVYSFGVVLFEVLCGRGAVDRKVYLAHRASKCIESGTLYRIIDPYLKGRIAPESFKKFVGIAYSCLNENGNKRPAMGEVEVALEQALELQEKADSVLQSINPQAECIYEEVSFFASESNDQSDADNRFDVESFTTADSFSDPEDPQL